MENNLGLLAEKDPSSSGDVRPTDHRHCLVLWVNNIGLSIKEQVALGSVIYNKQNV